jgi:hypothetical protein
MFLLKAVALVSTILLLAWMYYFMVGCGPLLVLKHDATQDSQIIYRFFRFHYKVVLLLSVVASLCFFLVGNYVFAAAMVAILLYGLFARQIIVANMGRMSEVMIANDMPSIRAFRRLHISGFALNVVMLVAFTWAISRPELALFRCASVPPGCTGSDCRQQCSL